MYIISLNTVLINMFTDKDAEILSNPMIKVEETNIHLGKSKDYPSFGWDNEYGQVDCK